MSNQYALASSEYGSLSTRTKLQMMQLCVDERIRLRAWWTVLETKTRLFSPTTTARFSYPRALVPAPPENVMLVRYMSPPWTPINVTAASLNLGPGCWTRKLETQTRLFASCRVDARKPFLPYTVMIHWPGFRVVVAPICVFTELLQSPCN